MRRGAKHKWLSMVVVQRLVKLSQIVQMTPQNVQIATKIMSQTRVSAAFGKKEKEILKIKYTEMSHNLKQEPFSKQETKLSKIAIQTSVMRTKQDQKNIRMHHF